MTRALRLTQHVFVLSTAFVCTGLVCHGEGSENGCYRNQSVHWENADLSVRREEPRQCPYVVRFVGSDLRVAAIVDAPTEDYLNYRAFADAFNSYGQRIVPFSTAEFYEFWPQCDGPVCAPLVGYIDGATGNPVRDSIDVKSDVPGLQFRPWAWLILTGRAETHASTGIAGPSSVPLGQTYTWSALTTGDTASYLYQWYVNGVPASGATGNRYTRSFSTTGTHTFRVVVTTSDYVADTVERAVTVTPPPSLSVTVNGPTLIQPGATCTWYAIVSDGSPPYSYHWTNDGQPGGNDYWYTGSRGPGSTSPWFNLKVSVTDALGSAEHEITVYEDWSAGECPM